MCPWGEKGTNRSATNPDVDMYGRPLFLDTDKAIVDTVQTIAEARGVSMAQIGMAETPSSAPRSLEPPNPHHLADAVAALDIELANDEVAALEQPYVSRLPTYF
jgi:1-deoxyxylulose-5-phosphate synthase